MKFDTPAPFILLGVLVALELEEASVSFALLVVFASAVFELCRVVVASAFEFELTEFALDDSGGLVTVEDGVSCLGYMAALLWTAYLSAFARLTHSIIIAKV